MQAWVIGNWKQHPATKAQAVSLTNELTQAWAKSPQHNCQLMIIPTYLHLDAVATALFTSQSKHHQKNNSSLSPQLGVQDISAHSYSTGAFTGDCSAAQAKDLGASWTLVGHSERRQYHQEDNDQLCHKIRCALTAGLNIILCIGESLADYEQNHTKQTLIQQLDIFNDLTDTELSQLSSRLLVAYEPIWAIGTGKVPTLDEINAVNNFIKSHLTQNFANLANTPILYGGSVNEKNAKTFASSELINGVLVGGASLVTDKFLQIAQAFSR